MALNKFRFVFYFVLALFVLASFWFFVDLEVAGKYFWAAYEGIKEAYFEYGLYLNNQ